MLNDEIAADAHDERELLNAATEYTLAEENYICEQKPCSVYFYVGRHRRIEHNLNLIQRIYKQRKETNNVHPLDNDLKKILT